MLRKDAKWHPNLSPILWLPTLWIWRCGSRGLASWFHGGSPDSETGLYDPTFFLICTILGWYFMRRQKINWPAMIRANLWLFIFFGYMAISVFWSWDVFVSSKRWVRSFGDLTMALVVATNPGGQLEGIITVLRRCAYLLIPFSVVLCKYLPNLGRMHAKHWNADDWIGVTTHKNCLGMLCMVVGVWLIWELWHLRETRAAMSSREFKFKLAVLMLYGGMTAYLLNGNGGSRSVTSISCLLIGTIAFWQLTVWFKSSARFWTRVAIVFFAWLIISPGCQLVFGNSLYNLTLHAIGRNPNLTDRTILWDDCIYIGMEHHPILGAGYMGFWNPQNLAEIKIRNTNAPEEAHNGYIEVFLELGFVGVAIFAPVLIVGLLNTWRKMRVHFELGQLCIMMLVMMYIHNYSESGFPRPTYLTWFGFLLAVINLSPALMNNQPETAPISRGKNYQLLPSPTG